MAVPASSTSLTSILCFLKSVTLPAKSGSTNGSVTQYFVVYLKNTGADQTSADSGKSFTGTVTVTASTGAQIEATF